jgi:acetyl esterase/lipase
MVRLGFAVGVFLPVALGAQASNWHPPPADAQITLWPGPAPDPQPTAGPEDTVLVTSEPVAGRPWIEVNKVSRPTISLYASKGPNSGAAIVVFPGGGYQILAIDLEGTEVCDWLTARGITCVLLKYRVPGEGRYPKSGAYPNSPVALEDAQRAVGLVRFHATEWHIDPHRIGVLGFSAGGHLVAAISTHFATRLYPAVDAADRESCRPDFAVAIYPGHMMEHTSRPFTLNPGVPVTRATPPTFLVQAEDDTVDGVANSLVYFAALKRAKVDAEMHLYAHGGHAFGLRPSSFPITGWPEVMETWLKSIGMIAR